MLAARRLLPRGPRALASRCLASSSKSSSSSMQILESVDAFRQARRALPPNATLGLVPTMG